VLAMYSLSYVRWNSCGVFPGVNSAIYQLNPLPTWMHFFM
jgi:hypothetical protein